MFEKKLVEKDVEVTKVEKRMVEVYSLNGKDYVNANTMKNELTRKMAELYEIILNYSCNVCDLVWSTNMETLKRRMKGGNERRTIFGGDKMFEYFDEIKELKSIYSQLEKPEPTTGD